VSNCTDKRHSELLDCIKHGRKTEQRSFVLNMDLLPSLALLIEMPVTLLNKFIRYLKLKKKLGFVWI